MLLPVMRPLADLDEEEPLSEPIEGGEALALAPAIPSVRRQLLLAMLIRRARDVDAAQAARLAAELARLLDGLQREDLSLDALDGLVPDAFSAHWQETLRFLRVLAQPWQELLANEGAMDPVARQCRMLRRLAAHWQATPPEGPIIAAGSTGSIPATAELLRVVAALPEGAVVLPGLDIDLDPESWELLDPGHPQFGIKQLLDRIGVSREEVRPWPARSPDPASHPARLLALSEAMRPAATTERWRDLPPIPAGALEGICRIDCPGPREEAETIALILRQALETPGATAALVTPDRRLARRVAAALKRWDIDIDDSAGTPLGATPPGALLRHAAEASSEQWAPIPLLALLKHPLVTGGQGPASFNAALRALEENAIRGPRPAPGFANLRAAAVAVRASATVLSLLDEIGAAATPFAELLTREEAPLGDLVLRHIAFAEWLATDAEGRIRLWDGEAGEAAALFVNGLHAATDGLQPVEPLSYSDLFSNLMAEQVVRRAYGRHPRLNIWGPLEARLQHADLLILGGLNEGTWPAQAGLDPWLSRPMRQRLGLPAPERRIGLAAHDFSQAAAAPRVALTRSDKVDGAPTVPSRWLLRLDNVLEAAGLAWPGRPRVEFNAWREALDRPEAYEPVPPPAFAPPAAARPRALSVTRVETLMRDPYSIYARYILDLRPLEPLEADPGAAERGIAVHQALDRFVAAFPDTLPPDALDRLLDLGRLAFGALLDRPGVRTFWWPRFERIARWFLETEAERRRLNRPLATEVAGQLVLKAPGGPFTLRATADRIDSTADGRLAIIDYKTGAIPRAADVASGYAPQLPLEAAIAMAGGFAEVDRAEVAELSFWRLSGGAEPGEIRPLKLDVRELAEEAEAGLRRLIAVFDDPKTPYRARPRPAMAPRYGDYDHLSRLKEWATAFAGNGE